MSEIFETYKALKEHCSQEGRARLANIAIDFHEAAALALRNGFMLKLCSAAHFQLRPADESWLINLYPGNQRIYHDRNCGHAPFLKLSEPWTLKDAVQCSIDTVSDNQKDLQ